MKRFAGIAMLSLVVCMAVGSSVSAAPMTGSIWTTDASGGPVDRNIFTSKCDVYLNGGPLNGSGKGLPDGLYYVQVTEPNGTLLGTSVGVVQLEAVDGRIPVVGLCDILITASDNTPGYDDTTNPGGEYKVWVSKNSEFPNSESKTDNFKVDAGTTDTPKDSIIGTLIVKKFYDANANGEQDKGEVELTDWKVRATNTVTGFDTGAQYTKPYEAVLEVGNYRVWEYLPTNLNWMATSPVSTNVYVAPDSVVVVKFLNLCLGEGGGRTLGFWSNKNGQGMIDGEQLCWLTGLNLRDRYGSNFDPVPANQCPFPKSSQIATGKTNLRTWLLGGNAVSMAYMLSVQLAAMELNVQNALVSSSAIIYAPGTVSANALGFATVQDIMNEANDSLGAYPVTKSGSPARAIQVALKNALDKANNNLTFVQTAPGAYGFAD